MLRLRHGIRFADPQAQALLQGRLDALAHPQSDGFCQVKHNTSRTVYRGRAGDGDIYLKHYHAPSLLRRLARLLGRSDALREMEFAQYLASCGVPTAPPLAACCRGGLEWLATEALSPVVDADTWHRRQLEAGPEGRLAVRAATVEIARLIGRMHAAGVLHRDLHGGNILLRTDESPPRPVLMDLHRASRRRRLSRRCRAANLAQLMHDRRDLTTRTERLRFLKHYLAASGAAGPLSIWQRLVEGFAARHAAAQHAQRDRRVMGNNRYFARLKLPGGWRGHVVLDSKRRPAGSVAAGLHLTVEGWREALADPAALLEGPGATVIKDSPSSLVVRRRLRVGEHEVDVFLKRSRRKKPWKIVLDCFRAGRAMRAFRLGHALLTRRVATALPLAALERRVGPFLLDSIHLAEAVPGPRLDQFLDTYLSPAAAGEPGLSARQQKQLAQEMLWQLGRMLQRLHDCRFAHRDLKSSNVLVAWSSPRMPELVLIDLDGLKGVRVLSDRQRFQGLMRLNVSLLKCPSVNHAGRLRMLLGYLRRPGAGPVNFKPYWRVLEDWSDRKLRGQIRSRRRRQKAVRRPA